MLMPFFYSTMGSRGDINVLEIYLKTILGIFIPVGLLKLIRKPSLRSRQQRTDKVKKPMMIFNYETVKAKDAEGDASKVKVRWLITRDMGANNFAMRLFEMEPNGYSPLHAHPWEHEVFILEGEGLVCDGEKSTPLKPNDVVFVPPDEWHQFKNADKKVLKFLCLIPHPKE
jgi:quercetin dioxygenase-like cupin family protein